MARGFELEAGPIEPRRRGRPPGAKGKRSKDLAGYLAVEMEGASPAVQLARLSMVNGKELRAAGNDLLEAMAVKAEVLAARLKISVKEAWDTMAQGRRDLMPYVHQRLAQLDVTSGGERLLPTIIMPDGPAQGFQQVIDLDCIEVSPLKSHEGDEP